MMRKKFKDDDSKKVVGIKGLQYKICTIYLGKIPTKLGQHDEYLLQILLTAVKKSHYRNMDD